MNAHVSNIARICYLELRRLASIRRFLTSTATATLVSAFVLSIIDYCNSLMFGSTQKLMRSYTGKEEYENTNKATKKKCKNNLQIKRYCSHQVLK